MMRYASLLFSFLPLVALAAPNPVNVSPRTTAPKRVTCHDGQVDDARCCVWHQVRDDLQVGYENYCGNGVPDILRMAFHDAITWSPTRNIGGGADGSIVQYPIETTYSENVGLASSVGDIMDLVTRYNVTPGDALHFAAMVGVTNCPGSPQFKFMAGRPPPKMVAKDGFVPAATDSVTKILARMGEAGFTPNDLVALLASHSVGRADDVDPAIPGAPFDSTPSVLDGQFYLEVLLKPNGWPGTQNIAPSSGEVQSGMAPQTEIRLGSDSKIARDSRTSCEWQSYINNQAKLTKDFGAAMYKVSMVGQQPYLKNMVDCSGALPPPTPAFGKATTYPGGYSVKQIQKSCAAPFPKLATDPGVAKQIEQDED